MNQEPLSARSKFSIEDEDDPDGPDVEHCLLEQLHQLHSQLAAVRQRGKFHGKLDGPTRVIGENNKVIVCTMRHCVKIHKSTLDDSWQYQLSDCGFKSAIDSLSELNDVQWVSWPHAIVDEASQHGVRRKMQAEYNTIPVFFSSDTVDLFFHKFCSMVLWPLFHCLPQQSDSGLLDNFMDQYDAYCAANQKFLEVVSEIYKDGDLVLICDYHLMNLPALLRRRFPDITTSFFLHCPFPSSEFYRMLPVRQALLHGVLGADLVVFNHFDYVRHFLNACTRMLGLESSPSRVEYNGRLVSLGICPMGIDPTSFDLTSSVRNHAELLRKRYEDMKIVVGVDKLDISKGIPEKLAAMEFLLENYPNWRGKVVLFALVRDPGAYEYRELDHSIDELVGRVNGRFGSPEYCPVVYLKQTLSHDELVALYSVADVAVVNCVKEGINLQAMEFIASQKENCNGVLVYSEFAGCASSFKGALLVNPFDIEQVAASINTALTMSNTTKQIRYHQLARYVNTYTSALWAERIMFALKGAEETAREYRVLDKLDTSQLIGLYERSQKRLFLLDYDGTLMPYQSMSQLAKPSQSIINCLDNLTQDPRNSVYIISGRHRNVLEEWFGNLPRLGLAAEHGYWFRSPNHGFKRISNSENENENSTENALDDTSLDDQEDSSHPWQCYANGIDLDWQEEVETILEHFTERTPGSLLESKDSCYTWHFRDADPDFGLNQAKDMQLHFDQMLRQRPVSVVMAPLKKYVMIRPGRLNKGRAVNRIIACENPTSFSPSIHDFGFVLAIGDERTDEDMFDVAHGSNCFTCTVGRKVSRAQSYVDDPEEVLRILTALTSVTSSQVNEIK